MGSIFQNPREDNLNVLIYVQVIQENLLPKIFAKFYIKMKMFTTITCDKVLVVILFNQKINKDKTT